tara:strand:+ start:94 stop:501 length:408 start_codon:yes stop_codon:yes gene_type:complete
MIKRVFSTINKSPISVTNNAWNKIIEISKKQNAFCFLFSAATGGCNGFNYELNLLDKKEYEDFYNTSSGKFEPTMMTRNNAKIMIDPSTEFLLFGTTIDYIYENYSKGIFENKFVFIPDKNLTSSCGCGISFTPK